jgi:hypothetical protein
MSRHICRSALPHRASWLREPKMIDFRPEDAREVRLMLFVALGITFVIAVVKTL